MLKRKSKTNFSRFETSDCTQINKSDFSPFGVFPVLFGIYPAALSAHFIGYPMLEVANCKQAPNTCC